jgi:hypothetical protein
MNDHNLPIACNLNDVAFQKRRAEVLAEVCSEVLEVKELDRGYGYRFPSDKRWVTKLADFITFESACCPFLQFNLQVNPGEGAIWLELTGPDGTKEFLRSLLTPVQ